MANDNVENIELALKNILASDSPQSARQNFILLGQNIDIYLNQLETFYNQMENVSPIVAQYRAMEASQQVITYAIYKQLAYNQSTIESLLKQGYLILDKIRYFFTNEKILYSIGLISGRGKEKQLFEFQLTIQEILKNSAVTFNTRAKIDNVFKLRMTGGKKSLLETYREAEQTVITDVSDSSSVFSAIYDYVKTENSHGRKINKGNAFQAYKRIVANRSNQIPPEVAVQLIKETLADIRKNTVSSIKGGDFLTDQIKFYSAAPSLITTSLVRSSLQDISKNLKMLSNSELDQDFKNAISEMFIKTNHETANQIEEEGAEESKVYLNNLLKQLGFKIT